MGSTSFVTSQSVTCPIAPLVDCIKLLYLFEYLNLELYRIYFLLVVCENWDYNYTFLLSDSTMITKSNTACNPLNLFFVQLEIHLEHLDSHLQPPYLSMASIPL